MAKNSSSSDKPLTKTAFVRQLPEDMPAKEVVDKAKAAGIELSEAYVYEIRSAAKRAKKKPGSEKAAKAPAKRAVTSEAKDTGMTKREFVESFSPTTPATEVIAKAAERGLSLTAKYIYNLRSEAKAGKKSAPVAAAPSKAAHVSAPAAVVVSTGSLDALETKFVDLTLDLGLSRAAKLLEKVRAQAKGMSIS